MANAREGRTGDTSSPGLRNAWPSGVRAVARARRILLAHDAHATTCDALLRALQDVPGCVEVADASSAHDARAALQHAAIDVCFVCLDLPPAPHAGVRLAEEVLDLGVSVVLVTRSLRWIPANAPRVRELPWIAPDASDAQIQAALASSSVAWPANDEAESSHWRLVALT